MSNGTKERKPPQGLGRLAFRAPIYLYRAGLGWLLNGRFLLLNHIGRKSGKTRQAVLEVVEHDEATDTYYVASGYGRSSHWFQNIQANPEVTIQVGRRKMAATAEILSPEASGQKMVEYARRMPAAAKTLTGLVGLEVDGGEADFRRVGEKHVPFVALHVREALEAEKPPWGAVALLLVIVALVWLKRRNRGTGR